MMEKHLQFINTLFVRFFCVGMSFYIYVQDEYRNEFVSLVLQKNYAKNDQISVIWYVWAAS